VLKIKTILEDMVSKWAAIGHPALIERFVLRNGEGFGGSSLPVGVRLVQPKECFRNAYTLCLERGYRYFEGFGLPSPDLFPMQHAWVVDDDGRVIDNTWRTPEIAEYIGVEITRRDLMRQTSERGYYGVLAGVMVNIDYLLSFDPELGEIFNDFKKSQKFSP